VWGLLINNNGALRRAYIFIGKYQYINYSKQYARNITIASAGVTCFNTIGLKTISI